MTEGEIAIMRETGAQVTELLDIVVDALHDLSPTTDENRDGREKMRGLVAAGKRIFGKPVGIENL